MSCSELFQIQCIGTGCSLALWVFHVLRVWDEGTLDILPSRVGIDVDPTSVQMHASCALSRRCAWYASLKWVSTASPVSDA